MSMTPPEPVDLREQSQRASGGLLATALPAPSGWQRGLVVPFYGCGEPILRDKCIAGVDEAHRPNIVEFPTFPIEQGSTCSTLSQLDHSDFARQRLDATSEWAMGRQLATDLVGTGAPSLADAEVAGPYAGDDAVVDAIACLEQCAADSGFGTQWFLHTSVRGAAYARRYKMMDSEGLSPSGAQWIVSPGYPSEGATDDTVRFWATGPVWAAVDDPQINAAVDWRTNDDTAFALTAGVVAFDPCILCAVDVTVGACLAPQPPVPVLNFPEDGATVNPLSPFVGRGCGPNVEVELWVDEGATGGAGRVVDTTTTNDNGAFTFVGTTPIEPGTHEFWVVCGGQTSDRITVTVEGDDTETLSFNWLLQADRVNDIDGNFTQYRVWANTEGLPLNGVIPAGDYVTTWTGTSVPETSLTRPSDITEGGVGLSVDTQNQTPGLGGVEVSATVVGPYDIEFTASGTAPTDPPAGGGVWEDIDSGTVTYIRPVSN